MATGKVEFHEGAPREGYSVATNEEATKTTTYLALFFDWFYKEVSESERDMIVRTLEWRIDICCDTRYPKPTLRRIPTTGKSAISSRI